MHALRVAEGVGVKGRWVDVAEGAGVDWSGMGVAEAREVGEARVGCLGW